jgi:DNA-directed RNA polymerase specialized sigma24 family protein
LAAVTTPPAPNPHGWLDGVATRQCADRFRRPVRAGPTGPMAGSRRRTRPRPPPTAADPGRDSGWCRRLTEMGEDRAHGGGLGDEGDDAASPPTLRTHEWE